MQTYKREIRSVTRVVHARYLLHGCVAAFRLHAIKERLNEAGCDHHTRRIWQLLGEGGCHFYRFSGPDLALARSLIGNMGQHDFMRGMLDSRLHERQPLMSGGPRSSASVTTLCTPSLLYPQEASSSGDLPGRPPAGLGTHLKHFGLARSPPRARHLCPDGLGRRVRRTHSARNSRKFASPAVRSVGN